MPEFKSMPFAVKSIQDRTVTGIFSVAGNVDSTGDKVWPGAFTKTFAESGSKALYLWQHDFDKPPIAIIKSLREIGRQELPPEVLSTANDALGGAEVTREYLDTPRGNEVLQAIKAGSPIQASFGYDPVKFDFETLDGDVRVRNLREVKLWEVSDVLWGANDATLASKAWLDLETLLKQLEAHMREMKSGARHSAADVKHLNSIHKAVLELGATNCKGQVDEEADKDQNEADSKSRAGALPLTLLKQRLALLELSNIPNY